MFVNRYGSWRKIIYVKFKSLNPKGFVLYLNGVRIKFWTRWEQNITFSIALFPLVPWMFVFFESWISFLIRQLHSLIYGLKNNFALKSQSKDNYLCAVLRKVLWIPEGRNEIFLNPASNNPKTPWPLQLNK